MKNWKGTLKAAVASSLLGLAATLQAASIDGVIEFVGGAKLNGPLGTATAFTSIFGPTGLGNPLVRSGSSGTYAAVSAGTAAQFSLFSFNPSGASAFTLWSFSVGTMVYSFDVTSLSISAQNPSFLDLEGTGIAHVTGFDDTIGTWSLTDTGVGSSPVFSFGSHNTVVPEPSAAALILAALGGFSLLRRREIGA